MMHRAVYKCQASHTTLLSTIMLCAAGYSLDQVAVPLVQHARMNPKHMSLREWLKLRREMFVLRSQMSAYTRCAFFYIPPGLAESLAKALCLETVRTVFLNA